MTTNKRTRFRPGFDSRRHAFTADGPAACPGPLPRCAYCPQPVVRRGSKRCHLCAIRQVTGWCADGCGRLITKGATRCNPCRGRWTAAAARALTGADHESR